MGVYLPCLNVDSKDSGSSYSVGAFLNPSSVANAVGAKVLASVLGDSAFSFYIGPLSILLSIGINFEFWKNILGLGETRIDREKEAIQDVMTPIFRYLAKAYKVPITDNHALQFPSDGVRKQFERRPEIAALVDYTASTDDYVANYVFARKDAAEGQEQRVSNQFLANAAYNGWTVDATKKIWDAIVEAAKPECSQDKSRWVYNPEIVRTVAQMGALKRYIPLDVLLDYATHNELGTFLANEVIKMWGDNPDLVKDLPTNLTNSYSDLYQTYSGSHLAEQDEYGNVIPLMGRAGWGNLVNTVEVKGPEYPDFANPDGGIQSPGGGGTQGGGNGGDQGGGGTGGDQGGGTGGDQGGGTGGDQGDGGGGNQGGGNGGDQGGNGGTQGGDGLTEQQRFNYACRIVYKLVNRQTLTQDEYDWILTNEGSTAVTDAYRDPDCNPSLGQSYDPDLPTTDDCPTVPQDDGGGDQGTDGPPDQGDGDGGDQDQDCPPKCQEQIDIIKEKQGECCDFVQEVIVPEIKLILEWLTDIEYRVEGQLPTLPPSHEPFTPPTDPGDKPKKDEPDEPTGTTPTEPPFPPEVMDCLAKLCAPGEIPRIVKEQDRELVCREIPLCDETGGPWGGMAECWLKTNTPNVADVEGVFASRGYPSYAVNQMAFAFQRTFQQVVGELAQLGGLAPQGGDQGEQAQVWRYGSSVVAKLTSAFGRADYNAEGAEDIPIEQRDYIFADPADDATSKIKYVSVQPRDGERDPCTGVVQGTLEIP